MRRVVLLSPLVLCLGSADVEWPSYDLFCRATHHVGCEGPMCRGEPALPGEDIYVGVNVALASGVGTICTYTYCREFMLSPKPGDTLEDAIAKWTGHTLSRKRGSTGDDLLAPAIDYQISISEDRSWFFLGNLDDGSFAGWGGVCSAQDK
jgi:hypothetical protein